MKHDPARPFEVSAGPVSVRAAGTRFDVRHASGQTEIVLAEGKVLVAVGTGAPVQLDAAGESANVAPDGRIATRSVDLEAATCWTAGRLIFRATPLAEAIAEANRYSVTRITLADPALGDARVDGTFETGDAESFVAAVSSLFSLKEERAENTIILSRG